MRRLFITGMIASALVATAFSGANATIAFKGDADLVGNTSNPTASYSALYTVNTASNMLKVLIENNSDNTLPQSIRFNGTDMTFACESPTNGAGTTLVYYLMSPAIGQHTLTITYPNPTGIQVGAADYSGVGGFESCVAQNTTVAGTTTISVSTTHVNDWVMIDTNGYQTWSSGSGDVMRVQDGTFSQWAIYDSNAGETIGRHSFTTPCSTCASENQVATVFFPASPGPIPTAINCLPANPQLADNTGSGTTVCAMTVTMSDNSNYVGTNTVTPTSVFSIVASGNGNLTLARNLTSADDGFLSASINASYNNATISKIVQLAVIPTTIAGTPFVMGWKNVDPGASSTNPACPSPSSFSCDGQVVFTAPHAYTVNEITMRATAPSTGMALVDVYKAASGTPCAAGTKLHAGDFNASGQADQVQVLSLVADTGVTGNTHTTTTIDGLSANVILRGWQVGDAISGSGIPANDTIATIAAGGLSLTLASATTTTVANDALSVPTPVAVGDSICVVTSQPFPNGQASLTVTAQ